MWLPFMLGGDPINKRQKEVLEYQLEEEKKVIQELEKQYAKALKDINEKVKLFQSDIDMLDQALSQDGIDDATIKLLKSQKQSKIYQRNYQEALKSQVGSILDKMNGDNYSTIKEYLNSCYTDGFVGTMYSISGQGIPLVVPIDQAAAVKAVLTDSKVSNGLYDSLGVNVKKLKKSITQEISRGIASSLPYSDIARNLKTTVNVPLYNAKRIVRTESHRIQQQSSEESRKAAAKRGADVVRQWDSTLDGRTRDSHRRVDGEIRELDEKFSNGLMYPGDSSGSAAEVVNCRCVALTRARWALDEDELNTLKERAEYFGLDKTKNFEEYKEKYLKANDIESNSIKNIGLQFFACPKDINEKKASAFKNALASGDINLKLRREKQNEHIAGTKEREIRNRREQEQGTFSTFFYEGTDVEALIAGLFGTGTIEYDSENSMFPVEFISLEKPIGKAYNYGTKKYVDVSRIAIQYGKKGVHAYPVKDW